MLSSDSISKRPWTIVHGFAEHPDLPRILNYPLDRLRSYETGSSEVYYHHKSSHSVAFWTNKKWGKNWPICTIDVSSAQYMQLEHEKLVLSRVSHVNTTTYKRKYIHTQQYRDVDAWVVHDRSADRPRERMPKRSGDSTPPGQV